MALLAALVFPFLGLSGGVAYKGVRSLRMSIMVVVSLAVVLTASLSAAAESERSASAALGVSATVLSSCSIATTLGLVALHCAHGALGSVRVNGSNRPTPDPQETALSHMSVTGSLVTVDF
jgi:cytochrome c biogenesis protein CcdA